MGRKMIPKTLEELLRRASRDDASGCLVWNALHPNGPPRIGKTTAYQVAFDAEHGAGASEAVAAEGLTIVPACNNKSCVEPSHMTASSRSAGAVKGQAKRERQEQTHCINGHEFAVVGFYYWSQKKEGGARQCAECARIRSAARRMAKRAAS